jgi:hypothetical protein
LKIVYIRSHYRNKIDEKLSLLDEWKTSGSMNTELKVDVSSASDSQILGLCVYLMEKDCHFTCDGIWEEPILQVGERGKV